MEHDLYLEEDWIASPLGDLSVNVFTFTFSCIPEPQPYSNVLQMMLIKTQGVIEMG